MSHPPYRALSFGLRLVSGLVAVAGVLMIVANQPLIMRVLMHPPASEVSTLLLVIQGAGWSNADDQRECCSWLPAILRAMSQSSTG